eukprot:CAMPEP_0115061974 /NCGR_PEP_ID=MMETSP0227-20121206/8297_1 /TAXON_ID=89957 /ORGANISM="Polarella glacialis, Strain CCMP 1383" /LENGTH=489 /DNA_ID=CAMNT_0002447319 /DNA_START=41 /DNA_END=1510 /DNA_ORIENTATION=-
MGNGQLQRQVGEVWQDLSRKEERGYYRVWTVIPERPDRYHKQARFDKFRELPEATRPVWAVAVAEVNMILAAATAAVEVHLWDIQDMELKVTLKGHTGQVWDVKFSSNETTLASCSSDMTIRLWETSSGNPLGVLRGHSAGIRCLAFSYDGYLMSGDMDSNLCLWEAENPNPIKCWKAHEGNVHSLSFSKADPSMALSVGADGSVAAWFINREREESVLGGRFAGGDGSAVLSVATHPLDTGIVAVGNQDGGVWLWFFSPNAGIGRAEVTGHNRLRGHTMAVWFVEFAHSGCLLASGSSDCTVRVWDVSRVERPTLTAIFKAHDSWVRQVRFGGRLTKAGHSLVTCSTDGTCSIWAAPGRLKKLKPEARTTTRSRLEDSKQDSPSMAAVLDASSLGSDSALALTPLARPPPSPSDGLLADMGSSDPPAAALPMPSLAWQPRSAPAAGVPGIPLPPLPPPPPPAKGGAGLSGGSEFQTPPAAPRGAASSP